MARAGEPFPVEIGPQPLRGQLAIPDNARGLVIFAHGSGSSAASPRNQHVATELRRVELATLLFDLLTPQEAADRSNVFDIPLLASRLATAADWARAHADAAHLPIGYFGASTGAAAALVAASIPRSPARAIVSRGGRPDLAGEALKRVEAPTLLLVGSLDGPVITMNQEAQAQLRAEAKLVIIRGAGHLFEEPGTLDEVVVHAQRWFLTHLPAG